MRQKEQPATKIAYSLQVDVSAIETVIDAIAKKHGLCQNQILGMLHKAPNTQSIPSSIFRNATLGFMEALVKFLKEDHQLRFHEIARTLKRDDRVIWTTYSNSQKKMRERLSLNEPSVAIPISIFREESGPLTALSKYLHDELKMGFSEIATLIDRKPASVWACYHKDSQKGSGKSRQSGSVSKAKNLNQESGFKSPSTKR